MKLLNARSYLRTILSVAIFLGGCKNENKVSKTTILITPYEKATLDSGTSFIQLKILKIYPAKVECNTSERYANLYICKRLLRGDTIYVFEECEKVPQFAFDTSADHIPIIDPITVLMHSPNKVMIFVPADFRMPNNAKCLFAKLSDIKES